jgi:Secretion system C-terminal sorting domain
MKKIYLLVSIFSISIGGAFAQATPNAGFEAWTHSTFPSYDTPNNWDNLNPSTSLLSVYTCIQATAAADVHSGANAIKLITKSVFGQTANGIATTGTINTTTQTIGGGIPYTLRPDSMVGYYKYTPVTGDNGFAEISLLGAGGDTDTIGYVRFVTPTTTVGTYTRFSAPIVYRSTSPIVKSFWILSSSKDAVTHFVGSTAFFDDLNLVFVSSGINDQPALHVTVFASAATDRIIIKNEVTAKAIVTLYDVTGRKLMVKQVDNGTSYIDTNNLPAGLYIYSVMDENNKIIKTDKLMIQK